MNVFVLVENAAAHGVEPDELDDIVLGVFSAQKDAEECLQQHASYLYSQEGVELAFEDTVAVDGDGTVFFAIVERSVD